MNDKITILFIGDVVGEPGLKFLEEQLPTLISEKTPDFMIVNGENACQGRGLTETEATRLFNMGFHVITTGNHIWDNWKSKPLLSSNPHVLRPFNYPSGNAGRGYCFINIKEDIIIAVVSLQGRTYMQTIDCPFKAADYVLGAIVEKTKIIFVDFHAEATGEKITMGHFLDGRVSAIVGTHTHIPTADACILPKGTAYITDVGMTGPFDSVLGMKKEIAIKRFTLQTPHKFEAATDDTRICGCWIDIDINTGKALSIESFMNPYPRKTATY